MGRPGYWSVMGWLTNGLRPLDGVVLPTNPAHHTGSVQPLSRPGWMSYGWLVTSHAAMTIGMQAMATGRAIAAAAAASRAALAGIPGRGSGPSGRWVRATAAGPAAGGAPGRGRRPR